MITAWKGFTFQDSCPKPLSPAQLLKLTPPNQPPPRPTACCCCVFCHSDLILCSQQMLCLIGEAHSWCFSHGTLVLLIWLFLYLLPQAFKSTLFCEHVFFSRWKTCFWSISGWKHFHKIKNTSSVILYQHNVFSKSRQTTKCLAVCLCLHYRQRFHGKKSCPGTQINMQKIRVTSG